MLGPARELVHSTPRLLEAAPVIYRFARTELDDERLLLRVDGSRIAIQPRAFDVLAYLLRHRDRVVSKDELMDRFWPDVVVEPAALNRALYLARKAIGDDARTQAMIQTVSRVGFRFVAPVTEVAPHSAAAPRRDPLVGRDELLDQLRARLDAALSGSGCAVFLSGEAGIGKTRLAQELLREAGQRGARTLLARCPSGEGVPPWWPWVQCLRDVARDVAPEHLAAVLGDGAGALTTLLPSLGTRLPGVTPPPDLDAASARFRVLDALACFLRAASAERPLVLLFDDLHWSDRSSLRALAHVAVEIPSLPILLMGTYRAESLDPGHGLVDVLAASSRNPDDAQIEVPPLSQAETAALLQQLTGSAPSPEQSSALWERTGGNPLFARQVVQLLSEADAAEASALEQRIRASVPPGLEGVIASRLESVSEACRDLLAHAAVLGAEFDADLLEGLFEGERGELADALEEANRRGLLRTTGDGRMRFAHALIQEALREAQPASRRARLEARIGEVIEKLRADSLDSASGELAMRFLSAAQAGGDPEKALYWTERATEVAMARLAWDEAAAHGERAQAAADLCRNLPAGRRAELWCLLGKASNRAGQVPRAREAFQKAAGLAAKTGDAELLARAALGLGHELLPFQTGMADPLQERVLEDALDRVPPDHPALRSRLLGRLVLLHIWSAPGATLSEQAEEAVSLAQQAGDAAALTYALGALYVTRDTLATLGSQLALTDELIAAADGSGDHHLSIWARHLHWIEALKMGRSDVARADLAEMHERAEALRIPVARSRVASVRAGLALMEGRLAEGEALALQALQLGSTGDPVNALQAFGAQAFYIRLEQGRIAELEDQVRGLVQQFPTVGAWRATLSMLLAETGRQGEAREALRAALGEGLAGIDQPVSGPAAVCVAAQVCAQLADRRAADALLPCLERGVGLHAAGAVGYYGPFSLFAGCTAAVLGRHERAEALLARADTEAQALGSWPYALRARLERARLLGRRAGPGDAEASRAEALGVASEVESRALPRLAARARALASGDLDA